MAELRWDLHRGEPGRDEVPRRGGAVSRRALEADALDIKVGEPVDQCHESRWLVRKGALGKHHARRVNGARSQRRLVTVDPDNVHLCGLPRDTYDGRGPGGQMCVEVRATLL